LVLAEPQSFEELRAALNRVKQQTAERTAEVRARAPEPRSPSKRRGVEEEPALPPGFGPPVSPVQSEAKFVASWARECFDEVGMLGLHRAPLPGDHWRVALPFERRMLCAIDAFAALGATAAARLEPMALDAPAPDPTRVFAAAMIGGCLEGRDALGAAERVLWRFGAQDPEIAAAFAGAMKLVPHSRAALMLRSLRAESDPVYRALGVEVLAYRGWMNAEELAAAAMDESPAVAARALPELALTKHAALEEAIERALSCEEAVLREAGWAAMALSGHPRAAEVLRAELSGPRADRAAIALALVGGERDARALLERAHAEATPRVIEALGWAGSLEAVPHLIELLEHEEDANRSAAASALDRILGAQLYEEVEVPPEKIEAPEALELDADGPEPVPLARLVSPSRDLSSEGSSDTLTMPTMKRKLWLAFWNEWSTRHPTGARYRRGHAHSPRVLSWELDSWTMSPSERKLLQRELVVRTGRVVRLDPHDFVATQQEAIDAWLREIGRTPVSAGSWSPPLRS
jgi:hypothetical protein